MDCLGKEIFGETKTPRKVPETIRKLEDELNKLKESVRQDQKRRLKQKKTFCKWQEETTAAIFNLEPRFCEAMKEALVELESERRPADHGLQAALAGVE